MILGSFFKMNTIVIFNYNYENFLLKAIESCSNIFNNNSFKICVLDDGSSDNSLQIYENFVKENEISNIFLFQNRKFNSKRRPTPAYGQLEGLKKILDSNLNLIGNYIFLLDADDYYCFDLIEFSDKNLKDNNKSDLFFLKVKDFIKPKNLTETQIIKRRAVANSGEMWPTIIPTSGIVVSKKFLSKNYEYIFNMDNIFADVWLDARINILAMEHNTISSYLNNYNVVRLIHNQNDSLKGGIIRFLLKQITALRYRESLHRLKKCRITIRYIITKISLTIFKTFQRPG